MNEIGYKTTKLFYELIFSTIISFYICLLIIWSGVYYAFKRDLNPLQKIIKIKCTNYTKCKCFLIIFIFLVYFVQFSISIFCSSRNAYYDDIRIFMLIIAASLTTIITLFTIYYTCLLKYILDKTYDNQLKQRKINAKITIIEKNNYMETNNSIINLNENEEKKNIKNEEIKSFLKEMFQRDLIEIVNQNILNKNSISIQNSNDDTIYFDNEYAIINPEFSYNNKNNFETENILLNTESNRDLIEKSYPINPKKKNKKKLKKHYSMKISENDIKNLNKIFYHSYFILGITILVLLIATTMELMLFYNKQKLQLIMLYLLFSLELIGFYSIYTLFIRDIKSQEYKNLNFIANLEKINNKNHKKIIKFDEIKNLNIRERVKSIGKLYNDNFEFDKSN